MILVKKYENLPLDRAEAARYMGCANPDEKTMQLIDDCISECSGLLTYSLCFDEFPITVSGNKIIFPFSEVSSLSLSRHLNGFPEAVIFAATVGIALDRLILKYSRLSPSRAVCLQAIGAAQIEALCDAFCNDLKRQKPEISLRFSPGYGDLPLNFQTDIFKALDCPRKIGLSLNSALLMSPSKSVTAIIGVK